LGVVIALFRRRSKQAVLKGSFMSDLIATLKKQHALVLQIIGRINQADTAHNYAVISAELQAFKAALLAHLKLEDVQLYPGMLQLGKQSGKSGLADLAKTFQINMENTSKMLVKFLSRFEKVDVQNGASFTIEWRSILAVLSARVKAEESTLYVQFERALAEASKGSAAVL
jgi:regulator of sigma D